jgi:glyoxylase-like metal-dependent hydrolase (beta-lactamase superfamily II)
MENKFELEKVTPNTLANTSGLGGGNIGAISLSRYAIVIDTTLYTKLSSVFKKKVEVEFNTPIKYLILTHYHSDHILGIKPFKDLPIISSEILYQNMQNNETQILNNISQLSKEDPNAEDIEFYYPNITFFNKFFLRDENKLEVQIHHTGGHTSGSSIIYVPQESVVFAGDLIFEKMFPYAGDETCSPEALISSLEHIKNLKPDIIVPGHGPILNGVEDLQKHIDFYKNLRKNVRTGIMQGKRPEEIKSPEFYTDRANELKLVTIEHWYNFYKRILQNT